MQAGIDDDDEKYAGRVAQLSDASSDDESDDAQPIGRDEGDEEESEEESDQESDDDEESDEDDVSGELEDEEGDSGAMFQRELEQLQQEEQQVTALKMCVDNRRSIGPGACWDFKSESRRS